MKYKAKKAYSELENKDNFKGLGMASKHIWLVDGLTIEFNGKLPEKLSKTLTEVGTKEMKGDK